MKKFLLGLLTALIVSAAGVPVQAQAATVGLAVSWTAPTTDANGLPLPASGGNAVTSYNVYASAAPLTAVPSGTPLAVVTAPATSVSGSITATVGSTVYVYVTACNTTGCSGLSSPGTKVVTAPNAAPGVPTNVTITVTVTP